MIKPISMDYLEDAFHVFAEVKQNMIHNGIDQWDDLYPNVNIIETDIINSHAFGYFIEDVLIGYMAINHSFDKEYLAINWQYFDKNPMIVHRLAIKPKFQRLGVAKNLMAFAENKAKKEKCHAVRLDAFSGNKKAISFYKTLGYRYAGDVEFRKGIFHCFEKMAL